MDEQPPFRFEFKVPHGADVQEPPPSGKTVFEGEVEPSPLLERLRTALRKDSRWSLKRVSPFRPDERHPEQRLVVWVSGASGMDDATIRGAVYDVVTDVIPGSLLVGIERTSM